MQRLIIYFCQSLLGSGQGRQQTGSDGRQTHFKKEEPASEHFRQSQNCCCHGNVKVEFSQCGKTPHVAPYKSRSMCCSLLGGPLSSQRLSVPPALLKHVHRVSTQSPYCPALLCKPMSRVASVRVRVHVHVHAQAQAHSGSSIKRPSGRLISGEQ